MAVSGAAQSYLMLLITRLALGAVIAIAGPVVASLTGDLFPAAERGRIYGFILAGEVIGAGIGFLLSGDVAAVLSWRYSFWVLSALGLVLAFVIRRLLPEPQRGGQSRLRPGARTIRDPLRPNRDAPPSSATPRPLPAPDEEHEEGGVEREVTEEGLAPHERLVLHEDPAGRSLWWAVRYVLSIRTNVALIIASTLGYFFFAGLRTFAVVFLRERFGIGQGVASTLLVVLGVGAIAGVLITGRLADRLIDLHDLAARPLVAGVSVLLAAALFLPALFTTSLLVAAPFFFLAAVGLGGANPPLDAARLDLVHHRLWGRAEAVRTMLRSSLEAVAPLLFGYLSIRLGTHTSGLGHPTGPAAHGGSGLDRTFLIMLLPLLASGLLLLWARRTYPRDVATAVASEHATTSGPPARPSPPAPN